jgi:UDP-glucose 4-epimerase
MTSTLKASFPNRQTVLLTGGAGYIGSHICLALMQVGLDVVVLDNLSMRDAWRLQSQNPQGYATPDSMA